MDPCIPRAWRDFAIAFRYHSARYEIGVENPRGATRGVSHCELDGAVLRAAAGSRAFHSSTMGRRTGCGSSSGE